jgi:hypothetical protein
MDIWYSLWKFGIFFPVLVFCTKKNLATLPPRHDQLISVNRMVDGKEQLEKGGLGGGRRKSNSLQKGFCMILHLALIANLL